MLTTNQYKKAFKAIEKQITAAQLEMLKIHFHAPGRSISMAGIAEGVYYANWRAVNLHYGKLAHMIASYVDYEKDRAGGQSEFIDVFATPSGSRRDRKGQWQWEMRPAVAQALKELRWV